jgi:competence ComEA-like helix-hairpin-helix protein
MEKREPVVAKPEEETLLKSALEPGRPAESAAAGRPAPPISPAADLATFAYPVNLALDLIPPEHLAADAVNSAGALTVKLRVSDLFEQLKRGRVSIPLSDLAAALPPHLLSGKAITDGENKVGLSLRSIIESVGVESLNPKVQPPLRQYEIARMADPFAEPAVPPKFQKASKPSGHPRCEPEDGRPPVLSEEIPSVRLTTYKPSADNGPEIELRELPGNVNINAASAEELMTLPDVDASIAAAIIARREKHGGFKSVFDLVKIHGISPEKFYSMTGMKAGGKRRHRKCRLADLLMIPPQRASDLDLIAKTIASRPGFSACIISSYEGFILAQAGSGQTGVALGAVLPGMLRHIRRYMDMTGSGSISIISFSIDGRLHTVSSVPNVMLTAIHSENMAGETEFSFIRKVSRELAWLLSLRAYAGPGV